MPGHSASRICYRFHRTHHVTVVFLALLPILSLGLQHPVCVEPLDRENTGCSGSNPWTASELTVCSILNGVPVESKRLTMAFETSVRTKIVNLTVDNFASYVKCLTDQETTKVLYCESNTPECKRAGADFVCIGAFQANIYEGYKDLYPDNKSLLCLPDPAVPFYGKPCQDICINYYNTCFPFVDGMDHAFAKATCEMLEWQPKAGEKCFGDNAFKLASAVKQNLNIDRMITVAVKIGLYLPMSEEDFTDDKKTKFKYAFAKAACILTTDKGVLIDRVWAIDAQIKVSVSIIAKYAGDGDNIKARLTEANINKELKLQGLPECNVVDAPVVQVISLSDSTILIGSKVSVFAATLVAITAIGLFFGRSGMAFTP
jgi:hypothetical protein